MKYISKGFRSGSILLSQTKALNAGKMRAMSKASILAFAAMAAAQNLTQSIAPSATVNGTPIVNPTLFATPFVLNVEDMWDLFVGPITEAYYTTTVSATPVPSSSLIPPPPLYYSPFPTGQQYPMEPKNESWSFPKDFWYERIKFKPSLTDKCAGGALLELHSKSRVLLRMAVEDPACGMF